MTEKQPIEADFITERVKEWAPSLYAATLFVPEQKRGAIQSLHALDIELSQIRHKTSDPMVGEMRLQWWRDRFSNAYVEQPSGNPLADALISTIKAYDLSPSSFISAVEARMFDLYDDPMPSMNDLEGYLGETRSMSLQLACLILSDGNASATADAAGHAGVAIGLTSILANFPENLAAGQSFIPKDVAPISLSNISDSAEREKTARNILQELLSHAEAHSKQAIAATKGLEAAVKPAFLPLAISIERLKKMKRSRFEQPFQPLQDPPLWRLQWILWRTARADFQNVRL